VSPHTGNNPYCRHRVLQLEKRGILERIVKVRERTTGAVRHRVPPLVEEQIPTEVQIGGQA
jgi:hypothetical protein